MALTAAPLAAGAGEAVDSEAAARQYFTDTEVMDQNGKPHRFYSDLLRGKRVLINFAFTTCKTACSPVTANLARVQKQLGERLGKDVTMITLSVDPVNDTPANLKRFAAKFNARPGWYFLTGTPDNVHALLKKLGGYTENPEQHSTVLLIGDTKTGNWTKSIAMEKPEQIVDIVKRINDPLPSPR
ncbi:MAG: SCO family protein [Myxococcaceae bacterium]